MDIGDMVILGGRRFHVRGFDPAGVVPRLAYLDDAETGRPIALAFDEVVRAMRGEGRLRLVEDGPEESGPPADGGS